MTKKYRILGLMSGTSLDGLDVALCTFANENGHISWEIEMADTISYDSNWQTQLAHAHNLSGLNLTRLNVEFGNKIGQLVNQFITEHNIDKAQIDCIASHGHTVFHQPEHGFTLQIGHGAYLAETTGLNTICDFRTQDMAKGGQGAPLVPIGDKLLFGSYGCCINIGGIANLSYQLTNQRIAFDICPANMVLNHLSSKMGHPYDKNGEIAATGTINNTLLNQLNQLKYYQQPHPKTLGREWVEHHIIPLLEISTLTIADQLHTFCHHIGQQIHTNTEHLPLSTILLTGGGSWNKFLVEIINKYTPQSVIIPNDKIIGFKEALIFALLAYLKVTNQTNILASVTGSDNDHIAGVEYKIR